MTYMQASLLPAYVVHKEPELLFSATDPKARHPHPLLGLVRYGPYGSSQLACVSSPIKVAAIAPHGRLHEVERLVAEFQSAHHPRERPDYLVEYPGFQSVYKVGIVPSVQHAMIELPPDLADSIAASDRPHHVLAEAITKALFVLKNLQHEFDVVLILIPARWKAAWEEKETEDFDLHDYIKATSASLNIPVQIINDDSALQYTCRCSVMWRLSIAIYCKAGGIPWTWADCEPDTAYIGVSYAILNNSAGAGRYAICCSQVFNADGAGLEFIAYEADDVKVFGRNPFLSRPQMLAVMSRSLRIYQHQRDGRKPRRVVVHKNTEFRDEEVQGCLDAFAACHTVELVHMQRATSWRAIRVLPKKKVDMFPCLRGTSLQLGEHSGLLWLHGNSSVLTTTRRNYYKGGKGIPSPLLLVRYAGHGSMDDLCRSALALSKMDWNSDGPYAPVPVTIGYAYTLANIVKRMQKLEARPYPFRFFM